MDINSSEHREIRMQGWTEGYEAGLRSGRRTRLYQALEQTLDVLTEHVLTDTGYTGNDDEDYLRVFFQHIDAYHERVIGDDSEEDLRNSLLVELHGVVHDDECPAFKDDIGDPRTTEEMIAQSYESLVACTCTPYDRDMPERFIAVAKRIALQGLPVTQRMSA